MPLLSVSAISLPKLQLPQTRDRMATAVRPSGCAKSIVAAVIGVAFGPPLFRSAMRLPA